MWMRPIMAAMGMLLAIHAGAIVGSAEEVAPADDVVAAVEGEEVLTSQLEDSADPCLAEIGRACRCCPEWANYFVFDVLFLQRDNATNG